MQELRYNPITDEWVIVSSSTQKRPVSPPKSSCPICPGGVEFPNEDYDLVAFENRYPSLRKDAPEVESNDGPFKKRRAQGVCEVIVYTKEHNSALSRMDQNQVEKLVYMWRDRTKELSSYEFIKYVFIFENRGKEVGASLPHPHGQIYAFPFIPKRIEAKISAMEKYHRENGRCVICDVLQKESGERTVYENGTFIALVPFYARFPFEVHIYPKRHVSSVLQLHQNEIKDLAEVLRTVTKKYDKLFDQEFPYMMMLFQSPVNSLDVDDIFHFHIEFNPPKRDKDKLKWMASVETGTWTFINPVVPEEAAKMLREVSI